MKYYSFLFLIFSQVCWFTLCNGGPIASFRPPAVPIVTHDPYFSIWTNGDVLYNQNTTLWDGQNKPFSGFIRVFGKTYRFLGNSTIPAAKDIKTAIQLSVTVTPTKSLFQFTVDDNDVYFNVTFFTPILPTNIELLSRPVTYLTIDLLARNQNDIQIYIDVSGELACLNNHEPLVWSREITPAGLNTMNIGNFNQTPFVDPVDKSSISWGYMYVAAPLDKDMQQCIAGLNEIRNVFYTNGTLPNNDDTSMPQAVKSSWIGMAVMWNVTGQTKASKTVMLAYDDVWSMDYFGVPMKPYYSYLFPGNFTNLLDKVWSEFEVEAVQATAEEFETQFFNDFTNIGGDEYATLCALSFRQVMAGCKAVWNPMLNLTDMPMWYFLKEISSAGDISTMDVIFPASPFFLYYNPYLLQSLLVPLLEYANNETNIKYDLAWAPHALGKWPVCNIEPHNQEQMPIETTADLLLMLLGVAQRTNYTMDLLQQNYWPLLENYAFYLLGVLPDPPKQLCTDDFEGAIPHNANLALKGILGLAAWSELCKMAGDTEQADLYLRIFLSLFFLRSLFGYRKVTLKSENSPFVLQNATPDMTFFFLLLDTTVFVTGVV
eukprot:TRINITY_DN5948_c0_g1_i1.p1 TRINITY_DN5948_c0_g1~~TRINITY_DN5948_c0_g1_i1.p1  ORF type:complete len:601 (+),score=99.37 TRINITY_DN5948_c0_g1_i1:386-2188(+)